jgi:hypothetical protein
MQDDVTQDQADQNDATAAERRPRFEPLERTRLKPDDALDAIRRERSEAYREVAHLRASLAALVRSNDALRTELERARSCTLVTTDASFAVDIGRGVAATAYRSTIDGFLVIDIDTSRVPPPLDLEDEDGVCVRVNLNDGSIYDNTDRRPDTNVLDDIASLLCCSAWSAQAVGVIADLIRTTGRTIPDVPCSGSSVP